MWGNNKLFRIISIALSISIFISFGLPIESIAIATQNEEKEIILSSNKEDIADTKTKAGSFKQNLKDKNRKIEKSIQKQNIKDAKKHIKDLKNSLKENKTEIKEEFKLNRDKLKQIKSKKGIERQEQFEKEMEVKLQELEIIIESLDSLSDSLSDTKGANFEEIKEKVKQIEAIVNPERPDKPLGNDLPNEKVEENNQVKLSSTQNTENSSKEPSSEDLEQTAETKIEKEIQDINKLTNNWDIVDIYNYVKNNMDYEPYYGSRKGATGTLQELAGNDVDQSSLLISLLRTRNIPSRYVTGIVEIPIEKVKDWTQTDDEKSAVRILASSGRPVTAVTAEGKVKSVRLEHTWVEAYIPYENYRGIGKNEGQKIWIPLDPSFKEYEKVEGSNLEELAGVNLEEIKNQLKNKTKTIEEVQKEIELGAQRLEEHIKENNLNEEGLGKLIGGYSIKLTHIDLLSQELPYKELSRVKEYSKIPSDIKDKITLKLEGTDSFGINFGEDKGIMHTINADETYGKKITISWEPATEEDKNIIKSYGGIFNTPSYLVEMKPQFKIDGQVVAEGESVRLGYRQSLTMTFQSQGTTSEPIENVLLVGGIYNLGLDYGKISIEELDKINKNLKNIGPDLTEDNIYTEEGLGEILNVLSKGYFLQLDITNKIISQIYEINTSRLLSGAIVGYEPTVKYMFKQPVEISEGSIYIDVDRNASTVVSKNNNKVDEKAYILTTGMISSGMEHAIFEEVLGIESVSAIKILEEAKKQNIPIHTISKENIEEKINLIEATSTVKTDIKNGINQGRSIIIPEKNIQINEWQGTGYMVIDEETGSAAYMISGGLLGGSTTDPVKIALLVNTIMTIIDLCQAIMVLASALTSLFMSTSIIGAMMGALIGTAFLALAMNQIIALADYYKTEDENQIILDAIIGVTTSLSLFMIQRLAHSLKLLIGGCFAEDTKVLTKEGYKKIQEIKEGEEVESFNEKTGEKGLKKVLSVEVTEVQKLINIKTERAEIKVTPSHPMLKIGNTWVFAGALKVGDKLAGYDGDEVEVKEIKEAPLEVPEKVYNLMIEDYHTYVVSEDSIVVHNDSSPSALKGTKGTDKLKNIIVSEGLEDTAKLTDNIRLNKSNRIDYSYSFKNEEINFKTGFETLDTIRNEMMLVQFHNKNKIGDGRSVKYWTTVEQAKQFNSVDDVKEYLALLDEWGPRDVVSIAKISAGTKVDYKTGKAMPQTSAQTGKTVSGNGIQILFKEFNPDWIVEVKYATEFFE